MAKRFIGARITEEAKQMLDELSLENGIGKSAVIELVIRKAKRTGLMKEDEEYVREPDTDAEAVPGLYSTKGF